MIKNFFIFFISFFFFFSLINPLYCGKSEKIYLLPSKPFDLRDRKDTIETLSQFREERPKEIIIEFPLLVTRFGQIRIKQRVNDTLLLYYQGVISYLHNNKIDVSFKVTFYNEKGEYLPVFNPRLIKELLYPARTVEKLAYKYNVKNVYIDSLPKIPKNLVKGKVNLLLTNEIINQATPITIHKREILPDAKMGYGRSLIFKQEWTIPISEEGFYLPFTDREFSFKTFDNMTLLAEIIPDPLDGFHYGASADGCAGRGLSIIAHFLHENHKTLTLKLYTKDYLPRSSDLEIESYKTALYYYAKMANTYHIDELVIGTGISHWCKERPDDFKEMVLRAKEINPLGRMRIDFNGVKDLEANKECVDQFKDHFSIYGVDLSPNPSVEVAQKLLDQGHLLSRVTFNGSNDLQNQQGLSFLEHIKKGAFLSIGMITPGFPAIDETEIIRGKKWAQTLKNWLLSF